MPKAKQKLPNKRIKVTLDDAIMINESRIYIDLFTEFGDLLLVIDAASFAVLVGEIANSSRMELPAKLRLVG